MTPTEQQVEGVRDGLVRAIDSLVIEELGRIFSPLNRAMRSYGEQVVEALLPRVSQYLSATPAQVPEGEPVHTPEVARIIEATERMAHRCGARFVPDPDKIAAFVARSPAAAPAEDGEVGRLRAEVDMLRRQHEQRDYPCSPHCSGYLREQHLAEELARAREAINDLERLAFTHTGTEPLVTWQELATAAEARVAELTEALRPFVRYAQVAGVLTVPASGELGEVYNGGLRHSISFDDLRQAARAAHDASEEVG